MNRSLTSLSDLMNANLNSRILFLVLPIRLAMIKRDYKTWFGQGFGETDIPTVVMRV